MQFFNKNLEDDLWPMLALGDTNVDLLWAPLRRPMFNSGALGCGFFSFFSMNQVKTILYPPDSLQNLRVTDGIYFFSPALF